MELILSFFRRMTSPTVEDISKVFLRRDRILLLEHKRALEYHRAMVQALESRVHHAQRTINNQE